MNDSYEIFNESFVNDNTTITAVAIAGDVNVHHTIYKLYGPVRDPLYVVIPISIIYASIFVTGIVGNISTCIVIARNKSMHTATNYYLFSLAVSDLLLLVLGIPPEIYMVWYKYPYVFGETFCVARGFAAETSTNASILTITAFTAERYVAICHPFLSQTMSKLSRAIKLILLIWVIALICAVPQAAQIGIVPYGERDDEVMCVFKPINMKNWYESMRVIMEHSFEMSTFLFFIVPMGIIMVLYILIGMKLKKSTLMKRSSQQTFRRSESTRVKVGGSRMNRHCRRHNRSTSRVVRMLVAVVVAFFICWAPFHMQRLIAIYGKREHHVPGGSNWFEKLYVIFTYVSGVLYYFSTTINPILYHIMSNKFREAFMETLAKSCRLSRLVVPHERRSYSSLSRSQPRHPGNYPSKTTGISNATGLAQDSTDCSGNSFREETQANGAVVDYSTSESAPIYGRRGVLTIDVDDSGPQSIVPFQSKGCSGPLMTHFIDLPQARNELARELPSPGYEQCIRMQGSSGRTVQHCNVINCRSNTNSKKRWWRLLDWLPGLKNLRTSRLVNRSSQNIIVDIPKPQDDCFLQLHTFGIKDDSCRPV
ncbi:pyrokinin-1 receptor-like [Phymastichus coffea]|uniref:pyrokinin-1 receptor-like n=1 Tax=Phymastichus coffea TaxID=108790 RepID=UPI00273C1D3B|nr:pyrokinin-1 receptor-like [Phymastichus coffea]